MQNVIIAFGEYLEERGMHFDSVIIGGAALLVMGVIDRATQDVDCLDPDIPAIICKASEAFAKAYTGEGAPLREDWLNNGPRDLRGDLPEGWRERTIELHRSKGIHLKTLGRMDLLKTKLFAFCDRQQDEQDCIALVPTTDELRESLEWLQVRDGNPHWPEHVKTSLEALAERLGYELKL